MFTIIQVQLHYADLRYDNLNRLTDEEGVCGTDGYAIDYTYDLVGNRTQRIVTANGNVLTTDYTYDADTDRLVTEQHTGPTSCVNIGDKRYYAYANGGGFYYRDTSGTRIGSLKAWWLGLPSVVSQWLFRALCLLMPLMFFVPVFAKIVSRMRKTAYERYPVRLSLYHRCMSVFLAYLMLIGPAGFQQLTQGDIQYSQLCTLDWANGGETIHYTYDDNGSVTTKITALTGESDPENNYLEKVVYEYNLANRLETVTTEQANGDKRTAEYVYNDDGIRVSAYSYDVPYGQSIQNEKTVVYVIDSYNHTGYAQVLEELVFNKANPDPLTETPDERITYTIGDDIITQSSYDGSTTTTEYLLYDGHGSTRQLVASDGSTVNDSYSYDGYGMMLGGNPTSPSPAATSLLYAGEHFDSDSQQYYNRARWYNPANGRFNRIDPYAGNSQDPQSLHKYLYAHCNPINSIDPTGEYSIGNVMTTVAILGVLTGIFNTAITGVTIAYGSQDEDGKPDGAIMSVSEVLGTRGFAAEGGFDIIWHRATRKFYAFVFGAGGFSPLSYFRRFRNSHGPSVGIGAIYNMNSINEWSGTGMTATWPLSVIHLLPKAMFSKSKMWGALSQLAKKEHNIRNSNFAVQFQFSSSGPAAWKLAFRSNSFTSEGGLTSRPIDLQSVGESLGELLGPLYYKLMQLPSVCDDPGNAKRLVQ